MNLVWLGRNIAASWKETVSFGDFARRLGWTYAPRLGPKFRGRHWTIGFRYPEPIGDIRLIVRANDGADAFIHGEVFSHHYYRLPLNSEPKTILDLGANIGLTALYFAKIFPAAQLACVEPVPANLALLRQNLHLNRARAVVIEGAVDAQDGRTFIELDRMDYGHRISLGLGDSTAPHLEVAAFSVPTLCDQLGWSRIGLLKVDIEGHENVLLSRNCEWLERVDAMCIEWHDESGEEQLGAVARRFGFLPPRQLPGVWFMKRAAA